MLIKEYVRPQRGVSEDSLIWVRLNNRASGLDNSALVREGRRKGEEREDSKLPFE